MNEIRGAVTVMFALTACNHCGNPGGGGSDPSHPPVKDAAVEALGDVTDWDRGDAVGIPGEAGGSGHDAGHGGSADASDAANTGSPCVESGCDVLLTLTGEAAGDYFGWVSADLGDIDADGVRDFVVGAPFNATGGRSAGRMYVYSGKTGTQLFGGTGETRSLLGFSVANAGDIDGDSVNDVVVGGPQAGLQGLRIGAGLVRIYSGKTGAHIRTLIGENVDDAFGFSVWSAGDIDKDGRADVFVGAPGADGQGDKSGRAYVYSGATGAMLFAFTGDAAGDLMGTAVAGIGDIDNDGYPDLAIGARDAGTEKRGRVSLYSGRNGQKLRQYEPGPTGAELGGFFVSSAGDVDKDGIGDIYAGDYGDTPDDAGGTGGRAYVWSGATGAVLYDLPAQTPAEGFGIGRARAGDVDNDGYGDLVIGAYTNSSAAPQAGRTYVFSGKTGKVMRTMTSSIAGEGSGYDAVGIGDTNGDGAIDFLITAATHPEKGANTGRVYVIAGERRR